MPTTCRRSQDTNCTSDTDNFLLLLSTFLYFNDGNNEKPIQPPIATMYDYLCFSSKMCFSHLTCICYFFIIPPCFIYTVTNNTHTEYPLKS